MAKSITVEDLMYAAAKAIVETYELGASVSSAKEEIEEAVEEITEKAPRKKTKNVDPKVAREEELAEMSDKELRAILIKADYDEKDVKSASKEDLIETIISEEFDNEDSEELDVEEDDEKYDRAELLKMTLPNLKKLAKEELDATTADLKGLDKDTIADALINGSFEVEDEDEDVDADEEDGEEEEPYTKDELSDMSLGELKALAKEFGLTIKAGTRQATIVKAILEAQED